MRPAKLTCKAWWNFVGLTNPTTVNSHVFNASERLTAHLAALIVTQEADFNTDHNHTCHLKTTIRCENRERQDQQAQDVYTNLTPQLKRRVDLALDKASLSWLKALPLSEHGFSLHKGEFRDAIDLCYNWDLRNTPQTCASGAAFSVDHAMTCHTGGFPTIRHNEICDIRATLLTEVCHNVAREPPLQPLSGQSLRYNLANREDGAQLDIRARGFWNEAQDAFFDVRVFHPNTPSDHSLSLQAAYRQHDQEKKCQYGDRVHELERGIFTPLVLTTTGGLSREVTLFYKRLADLTSQKQQKHYSNIMCW